MSFRACPGSTNSLAGALGSLEKDAPAAAHREPGAAGGAAAASPGESQAPSRGQDSQNADAAASGLLPPPAFNEAEKDLARRLQAQVSMHTVFDARRLCCVSTPCLAVGSQTPL